MDKSNPPLSVTPPAIDEKGYAVLRARAALRLSPPDVELAERYLRELPGPSDELAEIEGMLAQARTKIRTGEALYQEAREKLKAMERMGGEG